MNTTARSFSTTRSFSTASRNAVRFAAASSCVALLAGSMFAAPAQATGSVGSGLASASTAIIAGKRPAAFTSVTAHAGPGVGEVTFTWKHDGKNTTSYKLETGLSLFSKTDSSFPVHGRASHIFKISPTASTYTLTADQAALAGAPIGSGNHLYFRFSAVNTKGADTVRYYPYLQAVMPQPAAPKASGLELTIGSFNVRTAKAVGDTRTWMERRADVAKEIIDENPQIVALQELGPGRADGQAGSTVGTIRQTDSLEDSLETLGAGNYKLVRTTSYLEPGKPSGSQGTRILFDTNRLSQLSLCSETTGNRNYSSSCSIILPLLPGDSETLRRRAAYAKFRDLKTGKQFYVVSAHLDTRHNLGSAAAEKTYNGLRGAQVSTVLAAIDQLNTGNLPVIFAGDMNSWQNILVGNAPHDTLFSQGYYDTSSALTTANLKYSTFNNFATTQKASAQGFGARLDLIMVKGATGASSFTNVTQVTDTARPSDHNMIVAATVI